MVQTDINQNSNKINPLTIIRPQYKDNIEDVYIVRGDEDYIYSNGYNQSFDVIVVKRITPDMVRKFTYSFNDKDNAVVFMNSLNKSDHVKSNLNSLKVIPNTNIVPCNENEFNNSFTRSKTNTFTFDNDEVNQIPIIDKKQVKSTYIETSNCNIKKKKWDI